LLPSGFIGVLSRAHLRLAGLAPVDPVAYPGATNHYGLLWWNNRDSTLPAVPADAYWAWGGGDNLLVVVPSLDLVVARTGNGWSGSWNGDYARLAPFLDPIAAAMPQAAVVSSLSGASLALLALTLLAVGVLLQRSIKTPRPG
jgi:CubicO group peptidase (beta-lactamase class C family)